ncbi:MAG: hypothetical protein M3P30_02845 [Chloroflexota bacterium]|nr:hypothetical protein [Chloroflexota bacterium]
MTTITNSEPHDAGDFFAEVAQAVEHVHTAHPEFRDLRREHPWLTGSLGDPFAGVWFVAEIPSLGPVVGGGSRPSRETQWTGNNAAILLREMLVRNGFKTGAVRDYGGWNSYLTDVMKHAEPAEQWKKKSKRDKLAVAHSWAPVLMRELEIAPPVLVVSLGGNVDAYLDALIESRLIPKPAHRMKIHHYSYVAKRAGRLNGQWLGPMHPLRVADYDRQFQDVARTVSSLRR